MDVAVDVNELASRLRLTLGLLRRRIQLVGDGDLPLPQVAALVWLERTGPVSAADLARAEQISPQSMGTTLKALEQHGYIERTPDPADGRRTLVSATESGLAAIRSRREVKSEHLAHALAEEFTAAELKSLSALLPLLDRLAARVGGSAG